MEVTQMLLWTLLCFVLSVESRRKECSVEHVNHCYVSLVHYEGLGFPLYGENEDDLEETCSTINDSFECVEVFVDVCKGKPSCDEECQEMIGEIDVFTQNTGLREVQKDLCDVDSAIRQAYLENYSCLESNSNHYDACHNDSQMSQEHMATIQDPVEAVAVRCCFLTWYHDCFTNITRDSCNENATLFVSLTLYKLMHHITEKLCGPNPDVCERPPLPTIEEKTTTEMGNDIGITILHKNDTDVFMPIDIPDIDNSIDDNPKSGTISHTCSFWTFIIALCWIAVSKFIL